MLPTSKHIHTVADLLRKLEEIDADTPLLRVPGHTRHSRAYAGNGGGR